MADVGFVWDIAVVTVAVGVGVDDGVFVSDGLGVTVTLAV